MTLACDGMDRSTDHGERLGVGLRVLQWTCVVVAVVSTILEV